MRLCSRSNSVNNLRARWFADTVPSGQGLIDRALARHRAECPLWGRVEKLEIRLASLIAFMLGAGLLGGGAGAILAKLIGG